MTNVTDIHQVRGVDDLIGYFAAKLGWNIDLDSFSIEDVSYELGAAELGVDERALEKIKSLRQLRPFDEKQKWGMFCLDLDNWKFSVSALRNVLNGLVSRKRNNPTARIWDLKDLLFLCEWGDDENRWVGVVRFKANENGYPLVRSINCAMIGRMASEDALRIFEDRLSRLAWPRDTGDANAWSENWSEAFDADYVHLVEGILEDHPYISWETLCKKMLGIPGHCSDEKKKLFQQLEEESRRPGTLIGIVDSVAAADAVINKWVVYSLEWAKKRTEELGCKSHAETIGLDLYARMQENGWWFNVNMPHWKVMEPADCNHIVAEEHCLGVRNTLGREFKDRYEKLCAKQREGLARKKLLAEAETDYMKAKQLLREHDLHNGGNLMCALAKAGYPLAQYELGRTYEVRGDLNKADSCYSGLRNGLKALIEKAKCDAIKNVAIVAMAYLHFKGKDGPIDREWAIGMLKDLYEKGNVEARELLPKISPENVPAMGLDVCSRLFGTVQIDGVEYVFVGKGSNPRPVVRVDAKPNKLGEYRVDYVSCHEGKAIALSGGGDQAYKYVPKTGEVSRYDDLAKAGIGQLIDSAAVIRFLGQNGVRTGAEFIAFMEGNDLTGYRGVGPKKIAMLRSAYENVKNDYEKQRFD